MKNDEFAFFNTQLAAMLRDGLPLEGALKRLCAEMRAGTLRVELETLEADLARGVPLVTALGPRHLPELYKRMVAVGVKSGDLPGALTLLADYYQRQNNIWTRLKGLMVYPLIVLFCAFVLSVFLACVMNSLVLHSFNGWAGSLFMSRVRAGMWLTPVLLGLMLVAVLVAIFVSSWREKLRWRLPAFREASLARLAEGMSLMLKSGVPLNEALALAEALEKGTPAETELAQWRSRLASGRGKFSEIATPARAFPPLFIWTVAQSGEDLAAGFQRAAGLFESRARYRQEMLLYSALPCSILTLAALILAQLQPVFAVLTQMINTLTNYD